MSYSETGTLISYLHSLGDERYTTIKTEDDLRSLLKADISSSEHVDDSTSTSDLIGSWILTANAPDDIINQLYSAPFEKRRLGDHPPKAVVTAALHHSPAPEPEPTHTLSMPPSSHGLTTHEDLLRAIRQMYKSHTE